GRESSFLKCAKNNGRRVVRFTAVIRPYSLVYSREDMFSASKRGTASVFQSEGTAVSGSAERPLLYERSGCIEVKAMALCLSPEQLARYRDRRIESPEELAAIDAHLALCPACREALRSVG